MRTLTELYTLKGRVYLFVRGKSNEHFANTAKNEGFQMPIGSDDIFALHDDFSFCHTGYLGHMFFYSSHECDGLGNHFYRVDYVKWIMGANDYLILEPHSLRKK